MPADPEGFPAGSLAHGPDRLVSEPMKRPFPHRPAVATVPRTRAKNSYGWLVLLLLLGSAVLAARFAGPKLKERQERERKAAAGAVALVTAGRWLDADRIDEAEKSLASAQELLAGDPRIDLLRERIRFAREKEAARLAPLLTERLAAVEELALDDIPAALKILREIAGASSTPAEIANEAAAREAALAKATGVLRVPAEWPGDARVLIDGRAFTPEDGTIQGVHQGLRSIGFLRPGFVDPPAISLDFRGTRPLDLPAVEWRRLPGQVRLTSEPIGASVWRNGEDTGQTTPCTLDGIDSGNVEFVLKSAGYLDAVVTGELQAGSTLELSAELVVPPSLPRDGADAGERAEFNLSPSLRVAFRWCPPGSFRMGRGKAAGTVNLSRGFWIGETEFTQAMWDSLTGRTFATLHSNPEKSPPKQCIGPDFPACSISWQMVRGTKDRDGGLVETINQHLAAAGSSWKADLPTEAQWEYACLAGADGTASAEQFDRLAWHLGNSGGAFHPVASKDPNPWGIHDMQGNLHEWCADWFQESLPEFPATDPAGPESGWKRAMRGGSFRSPRAACLPSSRAAAYEMAAHPLIGFRLILRAE